MRRSNLVRNVNNVESIIEEVYDKVYTNSETFGTSPSANSEYNFLYKGSSFDIILKKEATYSFFEYCSLFVDGVFVQKILYNDGDSQTIDLGGSALRNITIKTAALSQGNSLSFIESLILDSSKYVKIQESQVATKICFLGDSITVGDHATNTNTQSFAGLGALLKPSCVMGWGYGTLFDFAGDADKVLETLSRFNRQFSKTTNKRRILIALGTNDYGLLSLPAVDFQTYYENLITALLGAGYTSNEIILQSPLLRAGESSLLQDYRDIIEQICIDNNFVYLNGSLILPLTSEYYHTDNLHPNDLGHFTINDYQNANTDIFQ